MFDIFSKINVLSFLVAYIYSCCFFLLLGMSEGENVCNFIHHKLHNLNFVDYIEIELFV